MYLSTCFFFIFSIFPFCLSLISKIWTKASAETWGYGWRGIYIFHDAPYVNPFPNSGSWESQPDISIHIKKGSVRFPVLPGWFRVVMVLEVLAWVSVWVLGAGSGVPMWPTWGFRGSGVASCTGSGMELVKSTRGGCQGWNLMLADCWLPRFPTIFGDAGIISYYFLGWVQNIWPRCSLKIAFIGCWNHWNRFLRGAERRDHAEGLSDRGGRAAEAAPGKLQPAAASAPVAGAWSSKNGDDGRPMLYDLYGL